MPDFLTGYSLAQIIGGVVFAVCLIYCVVKGVAYTPARCRCGATAVRGNAAGLCEACNYLKQAPGWRTDVIHNPGGGQTLQITTPTGHSTVRS